MYHRSLYLVFTEEYRLGQFLIALEVLEHGRGGGHPRRVFVLVLPDNLAEGEDK